MSRRTQDAIFYGLAVLSGALAGLVPYNSETWVKLLLAGTPLVIAAVYRLRVYGFDRQIATIWLVVWIVAFTVAVVVGRAIT